MQCQKVFGQTLTSSFAKLLLFLTLPLFFLPKVNLYSVESQTAGLRVDDLVLLGVAFVLFWHHLRGGFSLHPIEKSVLAVTGFALFSFCLNQIFVGLGFLTVQAKFLYPLRFFEYFLFFYVGRLGVGRISLPKFLGLLFCYQALWAFLQKGRVLGGFGVEDGYVADVSERVMGACSFPNEFALVIGLLFAYFAFSGKQHPLSVLLLALLSSVLIIWSGSRIALVALGVCLLCYRPGWPWLLAASPALLLVLIPLLQQSDGMAGRSGEFYHLQVVSEIWHSVEPESMDWEAPATLSNMDMSLWMRLHKWCHALKLYWTHPETYLTGVGPGFATAALDGGWLRILVETGLIGIALFFTLFFTIAKRSRTLFFLMLTLAIHMVFIDAHLAYKGMSLLFFIVGAKSYVIERGTIAPNGKEFAPRIGCNLRFYASGADAA